MKQWRRTCEKLQRMRPLKRIGEKEVGGGGKRRRTESGEKSKRGLRAVAGPTPWTGKEQ